LHLIKEGKSAAGKFLYKEEDQCKKFSRSLSTKTLSPQPLYFRKSPWLEVLTRFIAFLWGLCSVKVNFMAETNDFK